MHAKPLFLLLPFLLLTTSHACFCLVPSLERQYYEPDVKNIVKATVISRDPAPSHLGRTKYTLAIRQNFKGCDPKSIVVVSTPASSAACGAFLQLHTTYILPIRDAPTPSISSCDFIQEFNRLSDTDKSFLDTREKCCESKCVCASGNPPVNCFRQPCSPPETAPCAEATECRDNYCGPCLAEWFNDDGLPACL